MAQEQAGVPGINRTALARHLGVDGSTLPRILRELRLEAVAGQFPWRRIFRSIHGTEAARLPGHLKTLHQRHVSPVLDEVADLEIALRTPLLRFDEMAKLLGANPDTLSRALREGRKVLPITGIRLGPRLRRYRPLEVMLWRDDGILLDLPPANPRISPMRKPVARGTAQPEAEIDAGSAEADKKALFGMFAPDRRTLAG